MTVTLLRRARSSRDAHGNDTLTTTDVSIPDCIVWPGPSTETHDSGDAGRAQGARDATKSQLTIVFPHGTVVTPLDGVRYGGLEYEVRGDPADWVSPFTGWTPGLVVVVERVAG